MSNNSSAMAVPMSRKDLRAITWHLRCRLGLNKELYFPIIHFLELILPKIDPDFSLEILTKKEMGDCHGKSCPEEHKIYLRDDVYDGVCIDNGRDRFTVAHEAGHYLLHGAGKVKYARMNSGIIIPAYMNPEWQANTFAAELLAPPHLIKNMDYIDIACECKVSYTVARIQKSQK